MYAKQVCTYMYMYVHVYCTGISDKIIAEYKHEHNASLYLLCYATLYHTTVHVHTRTRI